MKRFRSHRVGRNLSNKVGMTPLERSDSHADSIHQLLHISDELFILRQLFNYYDYENLYLCCCSCWCYIGSILWFILGSLRK
ncbi:hypothetical protein [Chicken microvirus mg7_1]|nr:hypothetical protein [Chicken microvirus mg7_1]